MLWHALQGFLATNPDELGKGRDAKSSDYYNELKLAAAWRVQHPNLWQKYVAGRDTVASDIRKLQETSALPADGLPSRTHKESGIAPALSKAEGTEPLMAHSYETWLMHGTDPDRLYSMITNGMNERYAGTNAGAAFGEGVYFAEDAGKSDQYCRQADVQSDGLSLADLHDRLYSRNTHPGRVRYILVCRVALGYPAQTKSTGPMATEDKRIFPICSRELARVQGTDPPVHYHSLLGLAFPRYREFITFHSEYIYPEYILAYHRFNGPHGPV